MESKKFWTDTHSDDLHSISGEFHLKSHRCSNCSVFHKPEHEIISPYGLVALSECDCGHSIITILGEADFVSDMHFHATESFKPTR